MRTVGLILILTLGCSNLVCTLHFLPTPQILTRMGQTLRRRLPPTNAKGGLLNLRALKSAPFTIYCLSAFFAFLGLYTGQSP